MDLIGIDLAWQAATHTSAAAVGTLCDTTLTIHALRDDLAGVDSILEFVASYPRAAGIAIDAPLIVNNVSGQRACETALGRVYAARKAGCHAANLTLYPDPDSVRLADALLERGFVHLGRPRQSRWQIECYPHPALIEVFGLAQRHRYKKGRVADKRDGQIALGRLLRRLSASPLLRLSVDDPISSCLDADEIGGKRGAALKRNEDAIDAIICAYVAALYAVDVPGAVFGSADDGYIYVPQACCVAPADALRAGAECR